MNNSYRGNLIDVALGSAFPDTVIRNGTLVNVNTREMYQADILLKGERIAAVVEPSEEIQYGDAQVVDASEQFIVPGFMDPHVHIEASSVTVTEYAREVLPRGTTTVLEDPHEFTNVLGIEGIKLMYAEGRQTPLNFMLRVPGRVPGTTKEIETSGGELTLEDTKELLQWDEAVCLAGDINPYLVLSKDDSQFEKYDYTKSLGKTIGGQATTLHENALNAFIAAGPEETHTTKNLEETLNVIRRGMRVLITHRPHKLSAKDFKKIAEYINRHRIDTRFLLFCSDDVHANLFELEGHLDYRIRLAISQGFDPVTAI